MMSSDDRGDYMIILEGPDGSGKSSLAEKLLDEMPHLELIPKAVGGDSNQMTAVNRWTERSIERGFGPYLYDRHALWSEMIYGPAWRGNVRFGFDDLQWLTIQYALLQDLQPLVVICLPSFEEVWANMQRDEHNRRLFPNRLKAGRVYWQYHASLASHMDYLHFDYTRPGDFRLITDHIKQVMEARA